MQPVLQLLTVSQIVNSGENENEPILLFYGSKKAIRPFLYYNVLLTTESDFSWREDRGLNIRGASAVALLQQTNKEARYRCRQKVTAVMEELNYPPTGFKQAMKDAGVNLTKATLQATAIPTTIAREREQQSKRGVEQEAKYTKSVLKMCPFVTGYCTEVLTRSC